MLVTSKRRHLCVCVALCVFVCMCLCLSVKMRRCRNCKSKLKTSKRLDAFCCTLLTFNQLEILDNWKTNCIGTCESNTVEDDEEEEEEELSLFFFLHNKTPSLFFQQQQQQQNTISSLLRIRRKAFWTQFRHKCSWTKLSPVHTMARARKYFWPTHHGHIFVLNDDLCHFWLERILCLDSL